MRSKKKIILLVLVRGYVAYRDIRENPAKLIEAIPEGANIVLGEVRHTAVREGRKEWVLEATSANYSESANEAVFTDVQVTFFMENGDVVDLKGQKGIINTSSNDMQVSGKVRVVMNEYALETEVIEYNHKTRHIASRSPVHILGGDFELRADAMQVDLATETALFSGAVEGQIDADTKLRL